MKKTISLKTFIITILCITIISSTGIMIILASNSNIFTISEGIYPTGVTYIIWRSGSNYYAKDKYGLIPIYGTNATEVIQYAIDNTVGGIVFFQSGTYLVDTTILLHRNLTLKGSGWDYGYDYGTYIKADSGFNKNLIAYYNDLTYKYCNLYIEDIAFGSPNQITGHTIYIENATRGHIKNVAIYGSRNNSIHFHCVEQWIVEECYIRSGFGHGIYGYYLETTCIENNEIVGRADSSLTQSGIYLYHCYTNQISDNDIYFFYHGIELYWSDHNTLYANHVWRSEDNGYNFGYSHNNTIMGGYSLENGVGISGAAGLYLFQSKDNTIMGFNTYDLQGTPTQDYGIQEGANSDKNILIGCRCYDSTSINIFLQGSDSKARYCYNGSDWLDYQGN